jgi:bacillithiol biosynthesis deacetylase BshB1
MTDALFFGAHPDDIELTSGGLAAMLAARGRAVALVDLTAGESASRGTPQQRAGEAAEAARRLGVRSRECLGFPDLGVDRRDRAQLRAIIEMLRRHRPSLVVAPWREDAHPDHVEAYHLVRRACYVSGLLRADAAGERFRPSRLLFALYRDGDRPSAVVDITAVWETRLSAMRAHVSQLDPAAGPPTYLTHPDFLAEVEARARVLGARIGARYGEGYRTAGPLGVTDALALLGPEREGGSA